MFEPRGHHEMYGAILVDADVDEAEAGDAVKVERVADFGVIFIHNEGDRLIDKRMSVLSVS